MPMIALLNGGGLHRLTRAGETRRANTERDRADKAEALLAKTDRELAQALARHDAMQTLFKDLAATCRALKDELAKLNQQEEPAPVQPPITVPAPADLQDGGGWDPETSVTTSLLRLRNATYGPTAVGPAVIPVMPLRDAHPGGAR